MKPPLPSPKSQPSRTASVRPLEWASSILFPTHLGAQTMPGTELALQTYCNATTYKPALDPGTAYSGLL